MDRFNDILTERRNEFSNFLWVSRKLNTVLAYNQNVRPLPKNHKKEVLASQRIEDVINKISITTGLPKSVLEQNVKLILDEIGFNKQLKVIRWLGLVLAKICQKIYTGIYVNEDSIKQLKSVMGTCPVIFAPSHRSYADFILMSYICFTYDIEIPSIAAGMDFHGMWGMGSILRDTGAFFMRRSFNDDELYWETFKQYIHQIVTRGDLPIEFFIEGTRSRSCKSLVPKFGLLSMLLKPIFTGEVPDVFIVPINISYDRVLEEKLFAFELLGVPKPKESTSGFFKSLSIIKENFGSIYVDFAQPISVKKYLGDKLCRLSHSMGPISNQQLNTVDRDSIRDIGYEILRMHRKHCVFMPINLIAILLSANYSTLETLPNDFLWLKSVFEQFGARVCEESVEDALKNHRGLIRSESKLELIQNEVNLDRIDGTKLKGHRLSNKTMTMVVPKFILQLYVNPTLHYFINESFITVIILTFTKTKQILKVELFDYFQFLRTIFSFEFAFDNKQQNIVQNFETALKHLQKLQVIEILNENISFGANDKLQSLLKFLLSPFVFAYCCLCYFLQKFSVVEHNFLLVETQKQLESLILTQPDVHPYCLSLDTLTNCLQSLVCFGAVHKVNENNFIKYKTYLDKFQLVANNLNLISEKCYRKFAKQCLYSSKL